jgi:predicted dehydrogenase
MENVRLGVVGLGWFGGVLTESARATGSFDVVSCFARSEESRQAFATAHGCTPVPTLDAMLADPAVEAVLVVTPHSTHAQIVVDVASAGKHVFVEKPLTLTVADARRAIAAADRAGVVLQVGHNRRRQPANRRIKAMIDAGELGTVVQFDAMHTAPGALKPDLAAWRTDPAECPGGGMTALGSHEVDTFQYFVGPAARVAAFSTNLMGRTRLDEATTVMIEDASGPLAYIGTSYFAPPVVTVAGYGTGANVWNESDGARLFVQRAGEPDRTEEPVETLDTTADELAEFAHCIREGTPPETGGPEGLEVAAVLEAISESVATGRTVDLSTLR